LQELHAITGVGEATIELYGKQLLAKLSS